MNDLFVTRISSLLQRRYAWCSTDDMLGALKTIFDMLLTFDKLLMVLIENKEDGRWKTELGGKLGVDTQIKVLK